MDLKGHSLEERFEELVVQFQLVFQENARLNAENKILRQKVQYLIQRTYGRKSERFISDHSLLPFDLDLGPDDDSPEDDPPPPPTRRKKRRKKRKARLPKNLPVKTKTIDPEEVKKNPQNFRQIGEEVTEELDVIPQQYFLRRTIRRKYVDLCDRDRPPIIAPLEPRLLEGSLLSPGLLTDIILKKYVDHLPLNRQEKILKSRFEINLSRKTLCDWVGISSEWLKPIWNHMGKENISTGYQQLDETPIKYNDKRFPGKGTGHLWVSHCPGKNVVFHWRTSRRAENLNTILDQFKGIVQCDGYSAYKSFAKGKDYIQLAGCWAHCRRYFFEAEEESPVQVKWILHQIQLLYQIEERLREKKSPPAIRQLVRESESKIILRRLKRAFELKQSKHLPGARMGKAFQYVNNHWDMLNKFVERGELEIDNNLIENSIRPSALGKRNWLFIGDPQAGDRAAIHYSILETCRRLGINPKEYLLDVFSRLPSMKNSEVAALTPSNWARARTKSAA